MNRPRQSLSSYRNQQVSPLLTGGELTFDTRSKEQVRRALPVNEQVRRAIPVNTSMLGGATGKGDTPKKIQAWAKKYLGGKKKTKAELDDEATEETINQFADATDPETEAMNDIIKGYRDKLQNSAAAFNSPGNYRFPGFFNG